jgi:hypothetical protein
MKSLLSLPLITLGIVLAPMQSLSSAQSSGTSTAGAPDISLDSFGSGGNSEKFNGPTVPFTGVVVDAKGTPVPRVAVHVADGPSFLSMDGNEFPRRLSFPVGQIRIAHTGEGGEFSFAIAPGNATLFASTEAGCALLADQHTDNSPLLVTLQPWAEVRTKFAGPAGPSPMTGRAVYLWADQSVEGATRMIERIYEGTLDDDAAFTFARVIPGLYRIDRRKGALTGTGLYSKTLVRPGETLEIVIGGDGRPVVGRIQVPEAVAVQVDWPLSVVRLHAVSCDGNSTEKAGGEQEEGVEAGTSRAEVAIPDTYHTCLSEGRDFRLEDVKSGTYRLTIQLLKQGAKAPSGRPVFVDELKREIVVGPFTDGNKEAPEDLGLISMAE